ncbi:hypothetical protein N7535_005736 [Penicillium sp. DV-2018c]|nr:hypothetical protein N7461_009311 [Penicillium sp. DV-2018c]KAJ5572076.1 hypothetical protein N7535_005736 [Penicillium sp. DV-2018c]
MKLRAFMDDFNGPQAVFAPHVAHVHVIEYENDGEDGSEDQPNPTLFTPGPRGWEITFYPQSLLRVKGAVTIAPPQKNAFTGDRFGLRYLQMYNTLKEIFAAGTHYPFSNPALDTVAIEPNMIRSWQHILAIGHSQLAVLRLMSTRNSGVIGRMEPERSIGSQEQCSEP